MEGGGVLEIRPIFEAEDFGDNLPPEVRGQEDRLRQEIADKQKQAASGSN